MTESNYTRDIEEQDAILDSSEGDPTDFWERKQRELVTSVVDYNLATLSDLVQSKVIDMLPQYQRRLRWDEIRQSRLIESFLMNVPVPPIFLNEDEYGEYSVIDGKQRLTAVNLFLRGRLRLKGLEVFKEINGKSFDDLPPKLQTVFRTRPTLRAIIILRQSDEDVKFEVFQRLNSGGVRANPQEVRNSAYTGPLNDLILDLSENRMFHKLLGIKNKDKSAMYQEMRDAELVLRYLTFRTTWEKFSGGMRRQLDKYMAHNRRMSSELLDTARNDFLHTLEVVEACFGNHAFQRWIPPKKMWRQQVLAALYDAEMIACQGRDIVSIQGKQPAIIEATMALFANDEFRAAIDAATNSRDSFRTRIVMMKQLLDDILS